MRVVYDAWDWVYAPQSATARRLARLLQRLPAGVAPVVALPGEPPWAVPWPTVVAPTPATAWGRLRWEQVTLPRLARQQGAQVIHAFQGVPLGGRVPVVQDGAWLEKDAPTALAARLRWALAQGGAQRAQALVPFGEPPQPGAFPPPLNAPPKSPKLTLPTPCVVAYGPWTDEGFARLLRGWRWVALSLGDEATLCLVGVTPAQRQALQEALEASPWQERIQVLASLPPWEAYAPLHQAAALLVMEMPPYWQETVGAALALGVPIVGEERPELTALLGPAGYLLPPGDDRALGGALIAVLVEEHLAADLRARSQRRAQDWPPGAFAAALVALYRQARR